MLLLICKQKFVFIIFFTYLCAQSSSRSGENTQITGVNRPKSELIAKDILCNADSKRRIVSSDI